MLRTPATSLPLQSYRLPRTFVTSMLRNANNGVTLHRRRACHDPRPCCRQDGSLRSDQVLTITTKILAPAIVTNRSPIHGAFQSCRTLLHSSSSSKLHILRTVAVIAMSGPSHLRREEIINRRDYYGCVAPPGNRFRWQNVEGRLALFVSFPVDPTVIRCSGVAARGGQSVECTLENFPPVARPKRGPGFE